MKKGSLLLVLSFCLSLAARAQPTAPTCEKTLGVTWADIKQCMAELHAAYGGNFAGQGYVEQFPGAVFGYLPDGTTTPIIGAVGSEYQAYANGDNGSGPALWLGSVTKPFTHAAGLVALEQGGWNYDGLWTQIPNATGFFVTNDKYAASRALKQKISIRDVFTMSAGFTDTNVFEINNSQYYNPGTDTKVFLADSRPCRESTSGTTDINKQLYEEPGLNNECVYVPATGLWTPAREVSNRQVAQFLMSLPVKNTPLSQTATDVTFPYVYSNRSSIMVAWLAEKQSGLLPNLHAKQNIFTPLGMNDTYYIPAGAPNADSTSDNPIAEMHPFANGLRGDTVNTPEGVRPCNGTFWCKERQWTFPWPEGGLQSTPRDLFKFLAGLRDNTIPAFSATTRSRLLNDQLLPEQHGPEGQSRTAGFAYARNGAGGLVNGLTEGTVFHNGFPGTSMAYDPVRRIAWFFANQRLMRQKPYFQTGPEGFSEARIFQRMLTSLLDNIRPDNLDFHFDAARAIHRGLFPLRYGSALPPSATITDAYVACRNSAGACTYLVQEEYNTTGSATAGRWDDLSSNQRTMTVAAGGDVWPGNGSRHDDDVLNEPESMRNGPFRLAISAPGDYATVSSPTAPTAFTMSVWVRPRTTANNTILTRTVFNFSGDDPTWQIAIENGRFVANLWDTAGKKTVVGNVVTANAWYHVVAKATQNGSLKLFVNGVQAGANVPVGTFLASNAPAYSVGYYTVTAPGFDVAALNVYKQEHNSADIARNCNGLKSRFENMPCQ